ncbi:tetratricopeptide repeat protein [Shumkonia mesophila]|uniref:tetratricopeptide repeat protein n=1 Tax=Shumkonia mesophila TaxID=2838854 RepID=UPI0029352278|nr:tetratricopeptide repeat protein [Shumkonia mesophila]
MADQIQDSLLREIDDELRHEKYAKLWKKYGNYVVAFAVLLVVGVAGYQGWRGWDLKTRTEQSDRFLAALDLRADGNPEAARKALADLAGDAGKGYATLARFQEAALLESQGDRKGAVAAYGALSNDGAVPESFRQMAVILGALLELDTADPAALTERVAPLTAAGNPWRFTALEVTALLAVRASNVDKAREIFTQLSGDAQTPQGIRSRASEMLAILG